MIRVASYNIHKAVGTDRKRDPGRVCRALGALKADVVTLQEADMRFGSRQSVLPEAQVREAGYDIVPFHIRPGGIGWHGNAVLVKHGHRVRTARALDLPTLEPRGAVLAEVDIDGRTMRVIGMHLDLSGLWRRRQVRSVIAHLDACGEAMPTVLMGDLNQWSSRGCLSEFTGHPHYRLLDTPKSFHSRKPVSRLDRIITSHEWRCEATGTLENAALQAGSDHLPVWADLKLHDH
ncbi:endonuclease/exonuclease/phosphatase family protein [Novosphingopyxis iocasae]|uniref:endonuclease/exonuclease/phosphatase family protein n=1 Tax=Novosphingopyxis iocasae TaxID=2762729 RepID=UPI0016516283|nr:endonuclease/exonuclease/phosphatase family protein [Novosphingopyxis iocasae]